MNQRCQTHFSTTRNGPDWEKLVSLKTHETNTTTSYQHQASQTNRVIYTDNRTIILGLKAVSGLVDLPDRASAKTEISETEEKSMFEQLSEIFSAPEETEVIEPTSPRLAIRPLSDVNVKITVDGELAHSGIMTETSDFTTFEFERRLEFWTEDMSSLRLSYNKRLIQPQGDISGSRKLVFAIDRADL